MPPPPGPAAPPETGCFPPCRAGYQCLADQCVSTCNPPCLANQICLPQGCISKCNPPCPPGYACTAEAACAPRATTAPTHPAYGASLGGTPPERAAAAEADALYAEKLKTQIWLDLVFFTDTSDVTGFDSFTGQNVTLGTATITVWSPVVRASVPVDRWTLDLDVPLSHASFSTDVDPRLFAPGFPTDDSKFALGAVTILGRRHWITDSVDASVGAGAALPTAVLPDDDNGLTVLALGGAIASRGYYNLWWFLPETFTVIMPWSIGHTSAQGFDVGVEGGVGITIGTGDVAPDDAVILQLAGRLGYASDFIEAGARLRSVVYSEPDDKAQLSLEPYVVGYPGPVMLGVAFILNLDEPAGPLLDEGSAWGLKFLAGARF